MIINSSFLYFIEAYIIYFIILFYFNYIIIKALKFVIKNLIGYDLWTYIDDSFRSCPNNTLYDINSDSYILDYEYFDISDVIYYHKKFLVKDLELIYYFDLFHETKTREDDDHNLYNFMSNYLIPLQYKYYTLEHYWPEDEKVSEICPNFYNFDDLNAEFKFIYEDYKILWPIYKQYINTRELFYDHKLYDSKINQSYFFKSYNFLKKPLSNLLMLKNKDLFWKKEFRTFDLIEPSQELCINKHVTWFLLKLKYDEAKSKFGVFCRLPEYDIFDCNYYDYFISPYNNLIDLQTKWHQYLENKDEYFVDFINSDNLINYYINNNLFNDFYSDRFYTCYYSFDEPLDPFDYLFFLFCDRALIMIGYLFMFYYFCLIIFFLFVCYYSWYHHVYSFDFDLHFSYIRMLTRNKNYNDYNNYKSLIFNCSKDYLNDFFFEKNIKIELERQCVRDRNKIFVLEGRCTRDRYSRKFYYED